MAPNFEQLVVRSQLSGLSKTNWPLTHWPLLFGGADRDRTGDLLVANQALSQLSYSPNASFNVSQVSKFQNRNLETLPP